MLSGIEKATNIVVPNTTAFRPPLASIIIEYIVVVLTLAAFIYGVTSWCIIKKFRHFRNYVYLNAIISSLLRLITVSIIIPGLINIIVVDDQEILEICRYICTYFTAVQNYWLLVICYIFYGDFVKVFNGHVSRRYLKSSLFAWGVPLVTFIVFYVFINLNADMLIEYDAVHTAAIYVEVLIMVSPLMINCFIYTVVVCSLFRNSNANSNTATDNWRRFYIATLLFVLSDIIVLSSFIWDNLNVTFILRAIISKMQQIAIALYIPLVRANRELWRDFFSNRIERAKSMIINKC